MMRINIVNDELLMHAYSECDVWCFIPDLALLVLDLGSSRQAAIDKRTPRFVCWLDLEPVNDVLPTQNCHYLNFNTIVSIVNTV